MTPHRAGRDAARRPRHTTGPAADAAGRPGPHHHTRHPPPDRPTVAARPPDRGGLTAGGVTAGGVT
ncbi:hypothetical protein, partial [Actinacidiphila paucisporea]